MKITREGPETVSLEVFATAHDLELVITERIMDEWQRRNHIPPFMAAFRHAEVASGGMLRGEAGNGRTESEAIADYAQRVSGETLVIDAMKPTRREIRVPRLVVPR